jgi:hypothetical protein
METKKGCAKHLGGLSVLFLLEFVAMSPPLSRPIPIELTPRSHDTRQKSDGPSDSAVKIPAPFIIPGLTQAI